MKLVMGVLLGVAWVGCSDSPTAKRDESIKRARRTEAEINLEAIRRSANTYFAELGEYPKGTADRTPAVRCCEHKPARKCPPDVSAWTGVWEALDFEVAEPSFFQYTYESDGKTFKARAIGDLDCDTTEAEYVLEGYVDASGAPSSQLIKPGRPD